MVASVFAAQQPVFLNPWIQRGAILDYDIANARAFWNNMGYPSEAAFLTAIGGSQSGITRTIGPYIDPTGLNWLTNGNFTGGIAGWSGFGTGVAVAGVADEMVLTSGGNLNGFAQLIAGALGKGFRFIGTGRRGTSLNDAQFRVASDNQLGSAGETMPTTGSLINSTSPLTKTGYFSGRTNTYAGARNTAAPGSGTHIFDDLSMVQAWPFLGFPNGAFSVAINATAPAAAVADQVLFQLDCDSETTRVRLVRLVADDHLKLIVTIGALEQANMDLGVVADGAAFSVAFSATQNSFIASVNGGAPVSDLAGVCPGLTHMRIGRSFTGDTWTGTIQRVTVF